MNQMCNKCGEEVRKGNPAPGARDRCLPESPAENCTGQLRFIRMRKCPVPAAVPGAAAGVIIAGFDSKFAVYVIEMPLPGFYNGMEKNILLSTVYTKMERNLFR